MSFPEPTQEQLDFFNEHGWIVVRDAIPQADLDELERHCDNILTEKERLAFDWAWDVKEERDKLHAISNVYTYVDAAHAGWLGWPNNSSGAVTEFLKVANMTAMATIQGLT